MRTSAWSEATGGQPRQGSLARFRFLPSPWKSSAATRWPKPASCWHSGSGRTRSRLSSRWSMVDPSTPKRNKFENIHGPYPSGGFHSPDPGDPFHKLPDKRRMTTVYMDALAKNGHVGLLETNSGPSADSDYINEAKCDACGTDVFVETF